GRETGPSPWGRARSGAGLPGAGRGCRRHGQRTASMARPSTTHGACPAYGEHGRTRHDERLCPAFRRSTGGMAVGLAPGPEDLDLLGPAPLLEESLLLLALPDVEHDRGMHGALHWVGLGWAWPGPGGHRGEPTEPCAHAR